MAANSHGLGERVATLVKHTMEEIKDQQSFDASAQTLREQTLCESHIARRRLALLDNLIRLCAANTKLYAHLCPSKISWKADGGLNISIMPSDLESSNVVASVRVIRHTTLPLAPRQIFALITGESEETDMLALESLYAATKKELAEAMEEQRKEMDFAWRIHRYR